MKRLDRLSERCIICLIWYEKETRAEIHHVRHGTGLALRASPERVIPLCPYHHRLGPYGEAYHAGARAFAERYADEETLLELTREVFDA